MHKTQLFYVVVNGQNLGSLFALNLFNLLLFLFSLSITYYLYYFIISLLNHCIISINANIQRICDSFSDMQEKIHLLVEIMFENQACSSNVLTRFYSNYILKFIYHSWLLPTLNYKPRILDTKIEGFHFIVQKLFVIITDLQYEKWKMW